MSDNPRIDALRRRIDKDPSSIAFAQLAEEYRRSGDFNQAVKVCREGLAKHPGYLSAQVTLGRALMELREYDAARTELEAVLQVAPDNLAAIRALADIPQRHGDAGDFKAQVASAADLMGPPKSSQPESYPALELDITPLEEALPVDVSLNASMPTFEEITEAPPAPPAPPASPWSFDSPPEAPAFTEQDLPSLEARDSLTLDVPPLPDFGNWTFDTGLALDLPEPMFTEPPLDQLETTIGNPSDPVLDELEHWLAAITADRSRPR